MRASLTFIPGYLKPHLVRCGALQRHFADFEEARRVCERLNDPCSDVYSTLYPKMMGPTA